MKEKYYRNWVLKHIGAEDVSVDFIFQAFIFKLDLFLGEGQTQFNFLAFFGRTVIIWIYDFLNQKRYVNLANGMNSIS